MFDNLSYNWRIYRALRRLAKQRVGMVFQPGNIWVIEYAIPDDEETDALLKTCFMRGWVEPLEDSIPKGQLKPDGSLPDGELFKSRGPLWKLTDSGWAAINRSHQIAILGLFLSLIAVIIAVT